MRSDKEILEAYKLFSTQAEAARSLGINIRTFERRLAKIRQNGESKDPRILTIDCETYPMVCYTWGMKKQYIAPSQVIDWGGLLCFAAKWLDESEVMFHSSWGTGGKRGMVLRLHELLNETDVVVGWNSKRYDERWFNRAFVEEQLIKPIPYKSIDLMKQSMANEYLPSYKLESRRRWLGQEGKLATGGFDLWKDVLKGDREARELMQDYNIQDVKVTEEEFKFMWWGGWLKGLPNLSGQHGFVCPSCGSNNLMSVKDYTTSSASYPQWQCFHCGATCRERKANPSIKPELVPTR